MSYYPKYSSYKVHHSGDPSNAQFIKSLEDQIQAHLSTISKYRKTIDDQSFAIAQMESELAYFKNLEGMSGAKWKGRVEALEQDNRDQAEMIKRQNETIQKLHRENGELRAEKLAVQHDLENFMRSSKDHGKEHLTDEELIENLKYELKCDQKEISELRRRVDKAEQRNQELEGGMAAKDAVIASMRHDREFARPRNTASERHSGSSVHEGRDRQEKDDFYIVEEPSLHPKDAEINRLKAELARLQHEGDRRQRTGSLAELKEQLGLQRDDSWQEVSARVTQHKEVAERVQALLAKGSFKSAEELLGFTEGLLGRQDEYRLLQYFQGTIVGNRKHGFCVEVCPNGERFEGMYEQGVRHGVGRLATKEFEFSGVFEKGQFDQDRGFFNEFRSKKTLTLWRSEDYSGEAKDDKAHGKGTVSFENGLAVEATFVDGRVDVSAQATIADGEQRIVVSGLSLQEMNLVIFSTPDKSQTWVLNVKTGVLQKS